MAAEAEMHQMQGTQEQLRKQLQDAQDEVKILRAMNQRGDSELQRTQQALAVCQGAAVRAAVQLWQTRFRTSQTI